MPHLIFEIVFLEDNYLAIGGYIAVTWKNHIAVLIFHFPITIDWNP
jgi:hypothetical protein